MSRVSPFFAGILAAGVSAASLAVAAPVEKSASVQPTGDSESVNFEVFLPLRNTDQLETLIKAQQTPGSAQYHQWLTPAQFAQQFGPTPDSVARAQAAIRAAGLSVTSTHSRSFQVVGDAGHLGALMQTRFTSVHAAAGKGSRLIAQSKPILPSALANEGARIVSFASLPLHQVHSSATRTPITNNRYSASGSYWFDDLKQAYDYPAYSAGRQKIDGSGVHVAILMSDLIYPGDVALAFNHENFTALTGRPAPSVDTVTVDGGGVVNGYGSFEASLDVQQVLGGAPGARSVAFSVKKVLFVGSGRLSNSCRYSSPRPGRPTWSTASTYAKSRSASAANDRSVRSGLAQ